jgi:hypothetical protein
MRDPDGQLLCTSLLRACCLRECKLAAPAALPGVCALSAGLVPVRVLFGHLKAPSQRSKWKSSDRCNGKDRPQVSQQNTHPPNRAGMNDRTHLSCLFIPCACIVPSIIGDRRSRLSYTDADRSATEEQPDAAGQDKEANPSEHRPDNR